MGLTQQQQERLLALCHKLVDQPQARIIVPAQQQSTGYWFGGGNLVQSPEGNLYLVGRYRNFGDSRTGVGLGERGLELAIFESEDHGKHFEKVVQFSKADLNVGNRNVLSIEGSALNFTDEGVELFVSTEKDGVGYPAGLESYLKRGTGVWTVDRLVAEDVHGLKNANIETVLESDNPAQLHIKDPFVYKDSSGDTNLFYCHHPFSWSSSNTGFCTRSANSKVFGALNNHFFHRGNSWDVAITRGTAVFDVPQVGLFSDVSVQLMFYDGGECLRDLDEHSNAVKRPRGYSCEELGGAAYCIDQNFEQMHRLSKHFPLFLSPYGTACSRYVDVLSTNEGIFTTWQQSQEDLSQPLVMTVTSHDEICAILT